MDTITNQRIKLELKKLKKKYKNTKIILFGSRAKNTHLHRSDVDIIAISPDFETIPFRKRPDYYLDNWKLPLDLEVLCYTPDEFDRKKQEIGLVSQAVKEGSIIR
jgi:predicted nucleotidyltransferase